MLAYAASRPAIAARRSSPHGLLFIATAHVVAIAALISAKMDLPIPRIDPPIRVELFPIPPEPAPPAPAPRPRGSTLPSPLPFDPTVPLPNPPGPDLSDPGPSTGPIGPGPIIDPLPPLPRPVISRSGPSLVTAAGELRPPYPHQKLILEEEASLTLRLSIDANGRVIAVEPVGRADPVFLAAARRHLLAHWRYKPAMEDGQAVASTIVTTLHFRIDG